MKYARTCASCQGVTVSKLSPSQLRANCHGCAAERHFRIARRERLAPVVRTLLEAVRQLHRLLEGSEVGAERAFEQELATLMSVLSETANEVMVEQLEDRAGVGAIASKDQLARVG